MVQRIRLMALVSTEDYDFDSEYTTDAGGRIIEVVRTAPSIVWTRDFVWFSPIVNTVASSPPPTIVDVP